MTAYKTVGLWRWKAVIHNIQARVQGGGIQGRVSDPFLNIDKRAFVKIKNVFSAKGTLQKMKS